MSPQALSTPLFGLITSKSLLDRKLGVGTKSSAESVKYEDARDAKDGQESSEEGDAASNAEVGEEGHTAMDDSSSDLCES